METVEGKVEGIYYKYQKNNEADHTLVLLHGLTGNSSIWNGHIEILKDDKVNFLNVDLSGHGHSDTPKSLEGYLFEAQAGKILKIIEFLKINKITIVSYSYSTRIGSLLYEELKEKTKGMIFIGPYFKIEKGFKEKLFSKFVGVVWEYLIPNKKHYLDYSKLQNYEKPTFWDNRYTLKSMNTKDYLGSLFALVSFPQNGDLGIENIKIPTLFIYGRKDRALPQRYRDIIENLENVKIKTLENKDHLFLATNARVVAAEIRDFAL